MLFLLPIVFVSIASADLHSGRIFGGEETQIELYPYQVSLEVRGRHQCGGSILSGHLVLTAAHCVHDYDVRELTVRAGSSIREQGGSVHQVERHVVHHGYVHGIGMPPYDVALLTLKNPIHFDATRRPIELFRAGEEVTPESRAVVTGWGFTEYGTLAPRLKKVELAVKSRSFCNAAYKSFGGLSQGNICALESGEDACSADSGGPLAVGGRLAGVVSSGGAPCGRSIIPGVYVEVADVRAWIDEHAKL